MHASFIRVVIEIADEFPVGCPDEGLGVELLIQNQLRWFRI